MGAVLSDLFSTFHVWWVSPASAGTVTFIGLLAAIVAIWGVASQRAIGRRKATMDLIAAYERDGDIIASRRKFIALAKAVGGLAPWAEEDKESTDETQVIRIVLNEFELISIGIQRGIIDYKLYRLWNRSGTIKYWVHAEPFVQRLRSRTNNPAIYYEFEEMVRWMRDASMPKRRRFLGYWF